ncbi:MAG TPA: flavodoxin family protein [Dehalococcoidia bacterium]|nr:flavodoxin family protein [Dehalococcoidia bacterium]
MNALIVYDSLHGNTEKIARAIAAALAPSGDVKVLRAGEANISELESVDLLIVGSPTQGGRPTPAIQDFLNRVSEPAIKGISVAAFDTRISTRWVGIFGYAAGRIAGSLKTKGGTLILSPEGFFVKGTEGPLKEGELERAASWAREIAQQSGFNVLTL